MTGAGLLVRTVDRLLGEDAGFKPRHALTVRLILADTPFIEGDHHNAFVDTLRERVRGLPGVQSAGAGSLLPPHDTPIYEPDDNKARFPKFLREQPCPWGGKDFRNLPGDLLSLVGRRDLDEAVEMHGSVPYW